MLAELEAKARSSLDEGRSAPRMRRILYLCAFRAAHATFVRNRGAHALFFAMMVVTIFAIRREAVRRKRCALRRTKHIMRCFQKDVRKCAEKEQTEPGSRAQKDVFFRHSSVSTEKYQRRLSLESASSRPPRSSTDAMPLY
jgi:hypothetical protein